MEEIWILIYKHIVQLNMYQTYIMQNENYCNLIMINIYFRVCDIIFKIKTTNQPGVCLGF